MCVVRKPVVPKWDRAGWFILSNPILHSLSANGMMFCLAVWFFCFSSNPCNVLACYWHPTIVGAKGMRNFFFFTKKRALVNSVLTVRSLSPGPTAREHEESKWPYFPSPGKRCRTRLSLLYFKFETEGIERRGVKSGSMIGSCPSTLAPRQGRLERKSNRSTGRVNLSGR